MKLSINGIEKCLEPLKARKRKIEQDAETKLAALCEQELGEISARTQRGEDVTGQAFEKYTDKYRLLKSGVTKSGKPRKKFPKGKGKPKLGYKVNLTWTGQMLSGMRAEVKRAGVNLIARLFFTPAVAPRAIGNQRKRKFFGLSKEQVDRIVKGMKDLING